MLRQPIRKRDRIESRRNHTGAPTEEGGQQVPHARVGVQRGDQDPHVVRGEVRAVARRPRAGDVGPMRPRHPLGRGGRPGGVQDHRDALRVPAGKPFFQGPWLSGRRQQIVHAHRGDSQGRGHALACRRGRTTRHHQPWRQPPQVTGQLVCRRSRVERCGDRGHHRAEQRDARLDTRGKHERDPRHRRRYRARRAGLPRLQRPAAARDVTTPDHRSPAARARPASAPPRRSAPRGWSGSSRAASDVSLTRDPRLNLGPARRVAPCSSASALLAWSAPAATLTRSARGPRSSRSKPELIRDQLRPLCCRSHGR